jgi:hypothetical protein
VNRRTFLKLAAAGSATLAFGSRELPSANGQAALQPGLQAVVATDMLSLRGGPGADEPRVSTLVEGTRVDLLASSAGGAWWRVAAGPSVGWVSGQYLEPSSAPASSGAFDVDLVFPFARQLTDVWCEAADIEMWMAYRGLASDIPSQARQQRIWDWEISHNAGFTVDQWNCSPYAAASAAKEMMPDFGFDHFRYDDQMDGSRFLAWLLANPAYREPSIVLIWRGAHYVLVRGVRAEGNPGEEPAGARILGFYIADPNKADRRWYGSDRFIPVSEWQSEVFLPVSYLTPHTGVPGDVWQGGHITVQRTTSLDGPTLAGQANPARASY